MNYAVQVNVSGGVTGNRVALMKDPDATDDSVNKKDAREDIRDIRKSTDGPHEKYRIVTETTPEDWSPYTD